MNLEEFRASVAGAQPPAGLPYSLQGLWLDAKHGWQAAHVLVQDHEDDPDCNRVHAYCHRKEGDLANAAYWYRRVGEPVYRGGLDAEWADLSAAFLKDTVPGPA